MSRGWYGGGGMLVGRGVMKEDEAGFLLSLPCVGCSRYGCVGNIHGAVQCGHSFRIQLACPSTMIGVEVNP